MLRDDGFSSMAKVDRYGRKLPKDAGKKELERYYRMAKDESKGGHDYGGAIEAELTRANAMDDDNPSISSSNETSSDEDSLSDSEYEEVVGFPDEERHIEEKIPSGEVTSRIAVVNLDWDNIRATDLIAVFSSFVSDARQIRKVSVYPSAFGQERIEREKMEGPPREIFKQNKSNEDVVGTSSDLKEVDGVVGETLNDDDEEITKSLLQEDTGQEFNSAELRRYQLQRLRYFYAVITCSSPPVARTIYEAVDGTEYLNTANFFDLRFIPDDVDFLEDTPRDECEELPEGYRPSEFVTDALQHSKVRLTWDADDGKRREVQKRAFSGSRADIFENDLKAYLGSDSSDDMNGGPVPIVVDASTNDVTKLGGEKAGLQERVSTLSKREAERQRLRSLLGLNPETSSTKNSKASLPRPIGDMQITFSSGLTASDQHSRSVFQNSPERDETTVDKYVRKEKERKARRKQKLKASNENPEVTAENRQEVNKEIVREEDLGFSDPFFADPSTVASMTAAQLKEMKRLKRAEQATKEAAASAQRAELELLAMNDDTAGNGAVAFQHFDMNAIAKAEKALAKEGKRKKKRRRSEREREALEAKAKDEFRIDVEDPRFGAVFERAEYAIDPTHPRFQETEGMRSLLEERRKRRKVVEGKEDNEFERTSKYIKRKDLQDGGTDLRVDQLIDKVKRRNKKTK